MSQERRRRSRLPWANLEAKIKIKKSLFASTWLDVRPFDFSVLGVGLKTTQPFEKGDVIVISFRLALDMGEIVLDDLPGIIRHKVDKAGMYSYGVEFDASAKITNKEETRQQLDRIEAILRKHAEIVDRIKP
ncbi:MAG: PilZ domain-containing protein [Hahellaceae bacterium]|nr:PilZ domain-containing protein [Hahellaceae bacterium]MCP5213037.1 PilZ domain-containing protein [Hahellaceae bacterium]